MMEEASQALARMDYIACERLCQQALDAARRDGDWWTYSRILLPLQEARRQRRINASEGVLRLGSTSLPVDIGEWADQLTCGSIVLTRPHKVEHARALLERAREEGRYVEVLLAECSADSPTWRVVSFMTPDPSVTTAPAPPAEWRDKWLTPAGMAAVACENQHPSDYFLDLTEALGDQVIAAAMAEDDPMKQFERLERGLEVLTDHEKLHQRLTEAARRLAHQQV